MKCPWCEQFSMVYNWERNAWMCETYQGGLPYHPPPEVADGHIGYVVST